MRRCVFFIIISGPYIAIPQSLKRADSLFGEASFNKAANEYTLVLENTKNTKLDIGNAFMRRGNCNLALQNFDSAIADYFTSLKIFESIKNDNRIGACYKNIGDLYLEKQDYHSAKKYYNLSYHQFSRLKDSVILSAILIDIANAAFHSGEIEDALKCNLSALSTFKKFMSDENICKVYINTGASYKHLENDSAIIYYNLAETAALANNDDAVLFSIYNNIGEIYKDQNKTEPALHYLNKALSFGNETATSYKTRVIYHNLADLFDNIQQYDSAYYYRTIEAQFIKNIFDAEKTSFAAELSEKYESDKKDEKIRTQEIENKLKNRNLLLSLSGLALVAALAIISFISYRRKQKANNILQAQKEKIELLNKELDSSNQVKTKLFSVISHDLRSPISSLYAYLQLKSNSSGKTDKAIVGQTEQLLETLEDLLVWSKSQLHQFVPSPENLCLYDLCNTVINLTESAAAAKRVQIINSTRPDLSMSSDANMLTIVIRNLLSNAVTYALPQTAITIKAEQNANDIILTIFNETNSENAALLTDSVDVKVTSNKSGLGITLVKEFVTKLNGSFSYTVNQNKIAATIILPA